MSVDVYVCNCECHLPMGWRWEASQPRTRPMNFKPCSKCREVLHMPPEDPEPVRSIPVPLTVRRHTTESRAIFLGNLRAALPVDMLDEDKERIATILLDTAIAHGNELRRKRLISALMTAAEELEDRSQRPGKEVKVGTAVLREWSDLMADAAEEIRSIL